MKGGFRVGSEATKVWIEKHARRVVGDEAIGFLSASFWGAFLGSFAGAVFCFGLGAIMF